MAALGKRLVQNLSLPSCKRRGCGEVLQTYFETDKLKLEPFVLNAGHVNLILQSPVVTAVVICWGGENELTTYGHNHSCEEVYSYVVKGSVKAEVRSKTGESNTVQVDQHQLHEIEYESQSHFFHGTPGSVSVHVYCTEVMNICTHPIKCNCTKNAQLVICNEALSVTDAERGKSVAKICELSTSKKAATICTKSLRLYSNFRDLIELLHHEILPLNEGEFHPQEHIDKICGLLGAVRLNESEYKRYLRFKEDAYTRNLVGYDVPFSMDGNHKAKFTVLMLCWAKGQMSPIHDHAGSSCWVKVLQGSVREIRYDATVSPPKVIRDLTLGPNQVAYINDTQGVHAMGNPDPDQVAVSLHIYAPPYVLCTLFDGKSGEQRVGSMATARIPANPFAFVPLKQKSFNESEPLQLGEFYSLVSKNLKEKASDDVIDNLLERLTLQENEWKEFVHFTPTDPSERHVYTRSLVSLDSDFSLMVISWNNNQCTPIHEHGPNVKSWVKVLRGSIQLKQYDGTTLKSREVFEEGQHVHSSKFTGLHMLGNASDSEPAVSLHLYSPPFVTMGYLDPAGVERVIPIVHSASSTNRCCVTDPISLTDEVITKTRGCSFDETKSEASSVDSSSLPNLENLLSFFGQELDQKIFTNIHALIRFISIRDLVNYHSAQQVVCALNHMQINPNEWSEYMDTDPNTPDTNLIARGRTFTLSICRFDPCTKSSKPDNDTYWLKVLSGELLYSCKLDGEQIQSGMVNKHSSIFVSNKLQTVFQNMHQIPCIALKLTKQM